MYDDQYNRKVAGKVLARSRSHATKVDRLNGAGQDNADRVKHPASYWFQQENQVFADDISRPDVEPAAVVRERANLDLGSGRYSGGMVGFPDRAPLSAVEPSSVIRERSNLDLGAGRSGAGMSGGFWGKLAMMVAPSLLGKLMGEGSQIKDIAKAYGSRSIGKGEMTKRLKMAMPHGMKGGASKLSSAICKMKMGRGMSGGAAFDSDSEGEEYDDESEMQGGALPLHMNGCGDYGEAARQVGGKQCNCKCKCGRGRSGAGMSGGFGPVAPTTEALAGYDNRDQPKGLRPPPSVNQQPGMCGSGASGGITTRSGAKTSSKPMCTFPASACRGNKKYKGGFISKLGIPLISNLAGMIGLGQQPVSMKQLGRQMLPTNQLPSGVGGGMHGGMMCPQHVQPVTDPETGKSYGNRCKMMAAKKGAGNLANTTNYASNSGAIIPRLQSRVSIGSGGARAQRGAMVSKLMREHGMSLGEASRHIKEQKMK